MRFLKTLTLNRRAIDDYRLAINTDSEVIMNTTASMLVPHGTTLERTSDMNGMIRYNADTKEFEGYQGGVAGATGSGQWRSFRFKEPNGVVLQDVGPADGPTDTQTIFGPLKPDPYEPGATHQSDIDTNAVLYPSGWGAPQMAKNILVITETIVQLGGVNFDIVQNPTTTGAGDEITTGAFAENVEYIITNVGDTDFTTLGASANTVGTVFTIPLAGGTGNGTTGKVRKTGTYLEFYTPVPAGRSVHIIHKLNQ
jgi:hypothetical protein